METVSHEQTIRRENRETNVGQSAFSSPAAWRPSREMIARRAYQIWQRHGCPMGTAFHDWLAAEAELRSPH